MTRGRTNENTFGSKLSSELPADQRGWIITSGTVSGRADDGVTQEELAQLDAGRFFGEMSLLTGAPRSATIVAISDVDRYRLDAEVLYRPIGQPRSMSSELTQGDLLYRIRGFFGV